MLVNAFCFRLALFTSDCDVGTVSVWSSYFNSLGGCFLVLGYVYNLTLGKVGDSLIIIAECLVTSNCYHIITTMERDH